MTNKETVERNIGLTFDFVHYLIDNPSVIDDLPKKFKLEFLEKDFHKLETPDKTKRNGSYSKKVVRAANTFELGK
jgi:hypothetical protein